MAKRKPKIGDRVYWQSLDPCIPRSNGTITEISPSGSRVQVKWDTSEYGEDEGTYDIGGASCVCLAS